MPAREADQALIRRVEDALAGSPELDLEIAVAIGKPFYGRTLPYSTDLNAADTLRNWDNVYFARESLTRWRLVTFEYDSREGAQVVASTKALALCLAALLAGPAIP